MYAAMAIRSSPACRAVGVYLTPGLLALQPDFPGADDARRVLQTLRG
jgi:hypothetical protein